MEIRDAVVLMTGGAIRLGRNHALHLAQRGAHVAFTHLRDEPWQATKDEIEACGVRCTATELDARDVAALQRWAAASAAHFGRIDVLINNASPWLGRPFLALTEAEWDQTMDVTSKAAFFCAQAVAPYMLEQGRGVIVNVTDLSPYEVWPGYCHHAMAKAAVIQLTRYLTAELGPAVRAVAIAPGPVMLPPDFSPPKIAEAIERTQLKRLGEADDASRMIAFLIENDFLCGHVYFVDGGQLYSH